VDTPEFRVRATFLDHATPCLAYAFDEAFHINVWKPRLHAQELPTGPWLTELRRLVRSGAPEETPVAIRWRDRQGTRERRPTVGELKRQVLELTPGQRLCYVTDVAMSDSNASRVVEFAAGADLLYIESAFLQADLEHALRKSHLTAGYAGELARRAGVRQAVPFHFSTRYLGEGELLEQEFESAWRGQAHAAVPAGVPAGQARGESR
jgi:ribonuclease Z